MIDSARAAARLLVLVVLAAVAVAACGTSTSSPSEGVSTTSGEPDTATGRELFVRTCGLCHTLAEAQTEGSLGPDLDTLSPERERVLRQIDTGGGAMPPDLLEGQEAEDVAAYVAEAAGRNRGRGEDDPGSDDETPDA